MKESATLKALKARYFDLYGKERMGQTPEITAELDELETAIRAEMARAGN